MQGARAAAEIAAALDELCERGADVVVLARGGGSFEDLLPFSDERLVRAVAACPVPVVSAVGHEQDTPLVDLAADVRASTPSVAGRLVVPDLAELNAWLDRAHGRLERGARRVVERHTERLADDARPPAAARRCSRSSAAARGSTARTAASRALAARDARARLRDRPRRRRARPRAAAAGTELAVEVAERLVRGARRMSDASRPSRQQQAELEQIVERLERGDVGLDELTKLWERGEELYRRLSEQLAGAQGRIEELARRLGDDTPLGQNERHGHRRDRNDRRAPSTTSASCSASSTDDQRAAIEAAARRGRRAARPS